MNSTATSPAAEQTWANVSAIVTGVIPPAMTPLAFLRDDEREGVVTAIEAVMEDLELEVTTKYPDLDDELQRRQRLQAYKDELIRRVAPAAREEWSAYFDALMGIYIANGSSPRAYSVDEAGVVEFAA